MLAPVSNLGELPQWDLHDLYESGQSEKFRADLKQAREEARAFAQTYQGKLEGVAREETGPRQLLKAIEDYEALDDLLGRIGSHAPLPHVENTTDPERSKFYGDVTQELNDIVTGLLFFELELNRIEDDLT